MRDYPGLYELMNRPFRAIGLGLPWYSVFGNHDGLVQGNLPSNDLFALAAVGCVKPVRLSQRGLDEIRSLVAGGLDDQERARVVQILARDLVETVFGPQITRGRWSPVLRDARRRLLTRPRYLQQHFTTRGQPVGHGYGAADAPRGIGYYAFTPKPGVHFVVLDTVADSGAEGNVDETQYLGSTPSCGRPRRAASSSSSSRTTRSPSMVQAASGVHLGPGPCTSVPEPIECLFLRHRGVVAFVVGHQHRNRITPHPRAGDGGFWEIGTSAHIDWPQQSRLLDLVDNADGTLSIFSTVFDQGAPAVPGPRPARRGTAQRARGRVARIGRARASYNDPQADNGREGHIGPARDAPTGTSSSSFPTPTVKSCKECVRELTDPPFVRRTL